MAKKGLIRGIGSFLGIEELGQGIGQAAFRLTPESRDLESMLEAGQVSPEQFEEITTGGLKPRQVVGSALQTGLNIGTLGGAGGALTGGFKAAAKTGAKIGGAFGASEGIKEGTGVVPGAAIGATAGALTGVLANTISSAISGATKKLPERLNKSLLNQGIRDLRAEASGAKPVLAQQMIEKRISGNPVKIVETSSSKLAQLENQITQTLERNKNTFIDPVRIIRSLDDIVDRKRNVFGDRGVEMINNFKNIIVKRGRINVGEANKLKRDIYKELSEANFNAETLSTSKEVLRRIASALRVEIGEAVPVTKRLNAEQQFHIRLMDSLEDRLLKNGRLNVVGLSDTVLAGGGLGAGEPLTGITAAVGKRVIESPGFKSRAAIGLTDLGNLIEKLPTDTAGNVSKTAVFNLIKEFNQ